MNAIMTHRASLAAVLLLGTMLGTARAAPLELMPMPASVQQADGALPVGNGISLVWQGCVRRCWTGLPHASQRGWSA